MKLGLDLHGVIDTDPAIFSALSETVIANGGEVHVITGSMATDALHAWLKELGIAYTHLFSISSYHIAAGTVMHYDDKGDPWMDAELWNRTKAEYCARVGIDLHIDDSDVYGAYFTTPYLQYRGKWRTAAATWANDILDKLLADLDSGTIHIEDIRPDLEKLMTAIDRQELKRKGRK